MCCTNIITRTSFGPAVFGFNPSTLSTSTPSTATPYVYYTQTNAAGGNTAMANFDPLFDGNTKISGVFFVPGSRTVLFFGSVGTNSQEYGEASTFNDTNRTSKGYHSLNGDYAYQVWAYDANDLLAAADGQMQPWQVQPYATWNLDFPQQTGSDILGGVAFDPSTSRLYVTELGGDTQAAYSYLPVVQVYQLTLSSAAPAVQTNDVTLQAATGSPSVASGNTSNTTIAVGTIAAPEVSSADSSPQGTASVTAESQSTDPAVTQRGQQPADLTCGTGVASDYRIDHEPKTDTSRRTRQLFDVKHCQNNC